MTFTYAWSFGGLIPHLLAATKTPSATLIGMPAFLLLFGEIVHRGLSWMQKRERFLFRAGTVTAILSLLTLGGHTIIGAWQVTSRNRSTRTLAEIATYAETELPHNAVLLVELDADELRNTDDHLRLMFLMSKTAHPLSNPDEWKKTASQVRQAGGIPYLVSFREWSLRLVSTSITDKRSIYSDEAP